MLEFNRIYNMDCLEGMKQIPNNSIDLVLTDPPYGLDKEEWDKFDEPFFEKWITECNRVLKVGGAFWITLGFQIVAEVKHIFNRQKWLRLKNWVIWYRQDGWKGASGFAQSHEHILFYIKDGCFEFDLKEFGKHIKERRLKAGYKTVDSLMERMGCYTLIHRKTGKDGYYSGTGFFESGKKKPSLQELIRLNELLKLDDKYKVDLDSTNFKAFNVFFNPVSEESDDVWLNIKSEHKRAGHPTQKPVELFERIIGVSSNTGDLVLDPFMGSGTTAVACKRLNRNFIGIDDTKEYCEMAEKRLRGTQQLPEEIVKAKQIKLDNPIPPSPKGNGILGARL